MIVKCLNNCGNLASPYKQYCSHACYTDHRWPKDSRKYVKKDGIWYKARCTSCSKLIKGHTAQLCHDCYWKDKLSPKVINGKPIPHYGKAHYWIAKQLGKPCVCWQCGLTDTNSRRFHWANKSEEYRFDISDWIRLCASCHKIFDNSRKEAKV